MVSRMAKELRPDMCNMQVMMRATHEYDVLAFTHQSCLLEGLSTTLESVQTIVDGWMSESMEMGNTVVSSYLCGAIDDEGSDIREGMFGEAKIHNYYMVIGVSFVNKEERERWERMMLTETHEGVCERLRKLGLKVENS